MKLRIYKYIIVALFATSTFSCSDLLEEKAYTFVSGEDLVANKSYKELVAGAYTTLAWPFEWGNYHNVVNFDCDYQQGPVWAFSALGAGNFYEDGSNKNFYTYYYKAIQRASYHAYLINRMDIDENEKNNALGELAFLKAWSFFNLVQFYGELCLPKESVSEGGEMMLPRSPVKDVYEYIIELLKYAENIMYSTNDREYTKGHPSKGAAKGLLAKVYCTIGSASMPAGNKITVTGGPSSFVNSQGAATRVIFPAKITHSKELVAGFDGFDSKEYYRLGMEKAREVILSGDFGLYPSQEQLWSPASKNGIEFMFSLQTLAGDAALSNFCSTDYAGYFQETGALTSGYYVQSDHWFQMFDENDDRIGWGVMHRIPYYQTSDNRVRYRYYPLRDSVKVRLGLDGYTPDDTPVSQTAADQHGSKLQKFRQVTVPIDGRRTDFNFPFMRFTETLLLYAEADNEVNNGPSADALAAVNTLNLRNKSKSVHELGPWNQESFRSYILEERAKEFAAEGIRRFDLLRWGIYLQVMNAITRVDEFGTVISNVDFYGVTKGRERRHLLMPIPQDEVNTNIYIETNNPGW